MKRIEKKQQKNRAEVGDTFTGTEKIYNIAHKMNNLLTPIYGNLNFLEEDIKFLVDHLDYSQLNSKDKKEFDFVKSDLKQIVARYYNNFAEIVKLVDELKVNS